MIIERAILTEKSALGMSNGLYVLKVASSASKTAIKQELKKLYGVDAISIRTVNVPAKAVSFRRRKGTQSAISKAYVQLKAKQVLPGFELPKEEKSGKNSKS